MSADPHRESRIIECYVQMAQNSEAMLLAAQKSEWSAVIEGEKLCATLVAELKTLGDLTPSDVALREKKRELIRKILAHDAAIRDLAEPRMRQLELQLKGPQNARKLAIAYGATLRTY